MALICSFMQGAQLDFLAMATYTVFHKRIKLKTRQAKTARSRRKRHIREEAKLSTLDKKRNKGKPDVFPLNIFECAMIL